MGTRAGVGISHHRNPTVAGREAAQRALAAGLIDQADFVFMFAAVGYDQLSLVQAVRVATGNAPLCGCSGEGVIAEGEADESNFSVAVMAIASDELRFTNGVTTGLRADSAAVGCGVAAAIQPALQDDTVGLFVFADAMTVNFDRFQAGLTNALQLDRFFPLWGGAAGENWTWERTYQYYNDEVVSDGVAWALLGGQVRVAWASNHGCTPIGGERKVTRSTGNILYEIDGKPALSVLKEYMHADEIDQWDRAMISLCIGFKAPGYMEDRDQYIIRALIGGKDDATGAVFLPTEVSTGDSIWMTRRDVEKVSAGVDRISEEIRAQLGAESPKLVLQIECCGRGKMMLRDQQKTQILGKLQRKIGSDVPWLGFYSLAEIGPIAGHNCLHNYTSVVVALYGDEAETITLEQQQPIWQTITQAEHSPQPKPPQDEITELRQTNQRLVEEVKRLVATEHDLHEMQDQLDAQYRLYHQLYETGKQFNATFELANVLQITTRFVLYGLNFERCLILLSAPDKHHYQAKALDGYYDAAEYARVEMLTLAADESALAPLWARASQLICVLDNKSDALVALGQKLGMDEYIVIPLEGDAQTPLGLLAAGNTAKMSKFQVRVKPDAEVNVSLANLISQASIAVRNALFYQALDTSEKKYRSLFEDSNDAIIVAQSDGQLVDLNPAGQLLFGLHADEIESLNAQDLYVNPADRDQFRQAIEQNAAVSDFEVKMQRRDGSQFDALITATLRHAEDSVSVGYQGIIRDITVQKHNERLQAENLRLNTELAVTQRLQRMILPKAEELLEIEGLEIAAYMEPADEVGGDYYDVLQHNGQVKIGIGDVTGHGLESGVLMLMTQMGVRTLLTHNESDPVHFMDVLNRTLYHNVQRMEIDKNLSLALLNYTPHQGGGQLKMSGQHEELIVVRQRGEIELVDTMPLGFPVGLDDDIAAFVSEATIELEPGDGVVLYTDGITEAENAANEQYGMERLCATIRQHWAASAEAIKTAVIDDVRQFIGAQTVFDDITLLVLKQK